MSSWTLLTFLLLYTFSLTKAEKLTLSGFEAEIFINHNGGSTNLLAPETSGKSNSTMAGNVQEVIAETNIIVPKDKNLLKDADSSSSIRGRETIRYAMIYSTNKTMGNVQTNSKTQIEENKPVKLQPIESNYKPSKSKEMVPITKTYYSKNFLT
ncbi:unnamed protein product [Allacma fusca]|uniref:Uncharacterized protein n=1 Tax=Allacma fusca TaxID=39272 RepID=A0A8J2PPP6_9HEXA|nr:unnamed protein product [Allacma fusca]